MTWQEVRALLPHRWVVVEAINARNEGKYRVIPELSILKVCGDDSTVTWDCCEQLHRAYPEREFYFFHTDREELNIGLMDAWGHVVDADGKVIDE